MNNSDVPITTLDLWPTWSDKFCDPLYQ